MGWAELWGVMGRGYGVGGGYWVLWAGYGVEGRGNGVMGGVTGWAGLWGGWGYGVMGGVMRSRGGAMGCYGAGLWGCGRG